MSLIWEVILRDMVLLQMREWWLLPIINFWDSVVLFFIEHNNTEGGIINILKLHENLIISHAQGQDFIEELMDSIEANENILETGKNQYLVWKFFMSLKVEEWRNQTNAIAECSKRSNVPNDPMFQKIQVQNLK